jgi:hypothetical protein
MVLSTTCPGQVDSSPERSSPSPAWLQDILMAITRLSSGGYHNSDQELKDMQVAHTTRSNMEAAGKLEVGSIEDNLVEAQAEHYLQQIEDDVQEHVEVVLPGLSEDKVRINELRMVQSLYEDSSSSPSW